MLATTTKLSTRIIHIYHFLLLSPQLLTAIIDTPGDFAVNPVVTIGPLTSISSGTVFTTGLSVGVAVVSADRFVLAYQDSNGYPVVVDAGVFGTSIVTGRLAVVRSRHRARNNHCTHACCLWWERLNGTLTSILRAIDHYRYF